VGAESEPINPRDPHLAVPKTRYNRVRSIKSTPFIHYTFA